MKKQSYDFDLIVLGSGCGSVAAHIAADMGKRVAIVEPAQPGGDCLNWADVPTKALLSVAHIYDAAKRATRFGIRSSMISYNYPSIKAWRDIAVQRGGGAQGVRPYEAANITMLSGEGRFIGSHEITVAGSHYTAEFFLIATGARTVVPPIDGLEKNGYLTHREATELTRPPKSLFVVGAGSVGCEFAELFSIFGTKVYLSDITPRILPSEDQEVSELLRELFEQQRGMSVLTNAKVLRVTKDGLSKRVHYQQGSDVKTAKVDEILLTAGKIASTDLGLENAGIEHTPKGIVVNEYMQTSVRHVFAVGDVTGEHMLTHAAIYESRLAVHNIFQKQKLAADYRALPRIIFTRPEIASVGLNSDDCLRRDLHVKSAIAPLAIIARANLADQTQGFVKVITAQDGTLLGATIVSPTAGEMIHELALAIQHKLRAIDVANTPHAFPTWSETIRIACTKASRQ